jgi:uncharacterized protein (DUF2147 family)
MKNFIVSLITFFASITFADSIVGKWKTIDDETGKPKSVVEITQAGETFSGHILELLNPEKVDPVCEKCQDEKKDKPIKGLEIIWDLKETEKGKEWSGGKILDPKNGKIYKTRLRTKEDGKKLEVRGYIGFSLLGRSQTWVREN